MNDHKYIEMQGFIQAPFSKDNKKHANTGWFLDFNFESGGKVSPCRIWDSAADACISILEPNKPLLLVGYLNGIQLRVKSVRERIPTKYESDHDELRKSLRAKVSKLAKRQIHPVLRDGKIMFCHDAFTIQHNGTRQAKLDFCMSILGDDYVVKSLRGANLIAVKEGSVLVGAQVKTRYLSALDKLTKEALEFENVPF